MGGKTSKLIAANVARPFKNYNIQNKAQKAVEQHKVNPKPAPKHASSVPHVEKQLAENPHIAEELERKNETLIERMGKLHVETTGTKSEITSQKRPLPQSREYHLDPWLILENPNKIPREKVSLTQVAAIFEKHKQSKGTYDPVRIAEEYSLKVEDARNLLKYFHKSEIDEIEVSFLEYKNQEVQSKRRKLTESSSPRLAPGSTAKTKPS